MPQMPLQYRNIYLLYIYVYVYVVYVHIIKNATGKKPEKSCPGKSVNMNMYTKDNEKINEDPMDKLWTVQMKRTACDKTFFK